LILIGGHRPPKCFLGIKFFVNNQLRIAFFPDSYVEVNGAAMTCQRLVDYAKRNGRPFLVVHADKKTRSWEDGSVKYLSLKRSPLSFLLDEELAYDPFFQRHSNRILRAIVEFQPDVIHITGLNDVSIAGSYLAWKLHIPLVASWHTNLHEFAAQRLGRLLRFLPGRTGEKLTKFAERKILDGAVLYYKMPKVVLAPNQELVDLLGKGTGRVAHLMGRGIDPERFSPSKRTVNDNKICLGFVGRLRAEKNVRALVDIEKGLLAADQNNFEFLIVGEGTEREFLENKLTHAQLTGFLEGEELSAAYANMDIFVFPSETDAFGNVAQEAAASGVVPIVSDKGGPKYLVKHGETGFVASNIDEFVKYTLELMNDRPKLATMRKKAWEIAAAQSWDKIFDGVFDAYEEAFRIAESRKKASNDG
jgi:glycosyltransferase involved in cell wall biosynthesis